jgi:hypothetical protein
VGSLVRAFVVVALLGVPLLVLTELPRFLDLAASVPRPNDAFVTQTPGFRLSDATPASSRSRPSVFNDTLPPTLSPPVATTAPVPTLPPTPTGERIIIGNTGGLGAVLRSEPVTGSPVAALHEGQTLEVLERRNVPGGGEWVHVRLPGGPEGWVTGLVALHAPNTQ